jgi:hypothetical protein
MNHVHSVIFLHRYIVSVDNKFRKTYLLWKRGQSISTETVMQFTEDQVHKRYQVHWFLYCDYTGHGFNALSLQVKKSLKIPKGQSEFVYIEEQTT